MNRIGIGFAIALAFAALGGNAHADTWYVRWDGQIGDPHHFATIQEALDSPAVLNGDEIELIGSPFTGLGNRGVDFNGKLVTVRSQSGDPLQCTIDPELSNRGFVFSSGENGSAVLEGVTITNGARQVGGGIYILGSSPTIRNCRITECYAAWDEGPGYGGGVRCENGSSPVFEGSTISHCHVWSDRYNVSGAGLSADGSSSLTLIDCTISGNDCHSSNGSGNGGIECGTLVMDGCEVLGNTGMYPAGGIRCGSGTIRNSTIRGNAGSEGAGGVSAGSAVIENCVISGNSCTGVGGVLGTTLTIRGCTVSGNSGGPGVGGIQGDAVDLGRTILWGNCRIDGDGTLTLTCCAFDPTMLQGSITIEGPQVNEDPLFCEPGPCEDAPTTAGDYGLRPDSPCLPGASPCAELIGALGEGCQPTATEVTTWGRLKSGFR